MLKASTPETRRVLIWDLPTRLFHWALVVCVFGALIATKSGYMEWHMRFGLWAFCLILFRIIWGFTGTYYVRFTQFIKGPGAIFDYLKSGHKVFGHNPLGALSVIALLGLFGFQAVSGLFTGDGYLYQGPLYSIGRSVRDFMTSMHHKTEPFMIGLVVIHVGAILFYKFFKKDNLVTPMITGKMKLSDEVPTAAVHVVQSPAMWARFIISFGIAVLITYYISNGLSF